MIAVWIVLGVLGYLAVALFFSSLAGRRLRRQQPHNHPPKGGNHHA